MSCVDLLDDHRVFAEVLTELRRDVHARRLSAAWARFVWLDAALRAHIELEEMELLPRFDELEHPVANGAPAVFRRDHRLIERQLGAARDGWADPVARADALAQLDGILEHHDLREARYFKPRLDAELDPLVVERILEGWERAVAPVVEDGDVAELESGDGLRWAVAVGDVDSALAELDQMRLDGKAATLGARARARLQEGALVEAWDAVRLLTVVVGRQPGGITA